MSVTTTPGLHPFYATLGEGPYKFLYCYDLGEAMNPNSAANFGNMTGWIKDAPKLKAGLGTCAHCGMGINIVCVVRVGNGDLYGIGSDCVEKCSTGGIWKGVKAAIALRRKQKERAKREAKRRAQWDVERPAREAAQAEHSKVLKAAKEAKKVVILARIEQLRSVLGALAGDALTTWEANYTNEVAHTCGSDGYFSPPCDIANFYHSLAIQLIQTGSLSPRQAHYAAGAVLGRRCKRNEQDFDNLIASLT